MSGQVSVLGMVEALDRAAPRCPRCNSPHPARHPAVQFEGEVQVCPHLWHTPLPKAGDRRG